MNPKLYRETKIPSYLTARPTRDPLMAGQLIATKKWWRRRRNDFELFISYLVWTEAARGDAAAAARRLEMLAPLPRLTVTPEVDALAASIFGDCSIDIDCGAGTSAPPPFRMRKNKLLAVRFSLDLLAWWGRRLRRAR